MTNVRYHIETRQLTCTENDLHFIDWFLCVPQEFILGPLLFTIHLCDLFYFLEDLDVASYADDTKMYTATEKRVNR